MSNETLMDPQDFADRLERSFGLEPPHAPAEEDLGRGRRRLRRRRAGASLVALATVGVIGAGLSVVPGLLGERDAAPELAPATAASLTPEEIVATCMRRENVSHYSEGRFVGESAALALMGDGPRLMSSAVIENRTEATLLSEDGKYWGECQFRNAPDNGVKNTMSVYPTEVTFPRTTVAGVRAYEPHDEADARLEGTATGQIPGFEVICVGSQPEETQARHDEDAACPTFAMTWNDRRPAEVAAARVTTPDGVPTWADVTKGYVSFAYTGTMTPEIAEQVARGDSPRAKRVVLYDQDGNVLVDDHDPGHLAQDGSMSMENFPSLAWWLT
jgi:hypothetical protein